MQSSIQLLLPLVKSGAPGVLPSLIPIVFAASFVLPSRVSPRINTLFVLILIPFFALANCIIVSALSSPIIVVPATVIFVTSLSA